MTIDAVRRMPIFAGIADTELARLLVGGVTRSIARGDVVFTHGEPLKRFYLILSGTIQLVRTTPNGNALTIAILNGGESLGDDEIMDACRSYRTTAKAVENTTILEFPVSWLKETAKLNTDFALNLLASLSNRVHLAEIEVEHQATMSAPQLVACFLQRICVIHDFDPKGFDLPYSKTLIASRLGMESETFSRTLSTLKVHGITVKGKHVAINDVSSIADYVCGYCSIAGECPTHQSIGKKLG